MPHFGLGTLSFTYVAVLAAALCYLSTAAGHSVSGRHPPLTNTMTEGRSRLAKRAPEYRSRRTRIYPHSSRRNERGGIDPKIRHRGVMRRYITRRTTEPKRVLVSAYGNTIPRGVTPENDARHEKSETSLSKITRSTYERRSSSYSYYQRQWIRNGREYICTTCSRCFSPGICEQKFLHGGDRVGAMALRNTGACHEPTTGVRYEAGVQYVRVQEDHVWRCMCEGGSTHRIVCRSIARCYIDGAYRNRGDAWFKYSVYGYRMKCICYGSGTIAKWKCGTNIAQIDDYYEIVMSRVCLDKATSGEVRAVGETWTRVSKFNTREECACGRQGDANVIECITMVEVIAEPTPTAIPVVTTQCVISDTEHGHVGELKQSGQTWNITRTNGTAASCKCLGETSEIVCTPLCLHMGVYTAPGTHVTDGRECECYEDGTISCEAEVTLEVLTTCDDRPCWPGVICRDEENRYEGFTCGSCPAEFTGDGKTCSRITCSDRPCFAGVKCTVTENGGFQCGRCPIGFYGNGANCIDVRIRCAVHEPCADGVECVDTLVGVECGSCPPGFSGDGYTCEAFIERCKSTTCATDVTCTNTEEGIECGPCPAGFSGDGRICEDVRVRCSSNPCHKAVTCTDTDIGVDCGPCPSGFSGDGFECVDIRIHCSDRPCYTGVICRDTDAGFECGGCPIGFAGNGMDCVDVRVRCHQGPCANKVKCVDTDVGVECGTCPHGFEGDGYVCVDVRERCDSRSCFDGVPCFNTETGITCGDCPTGFTGDGFTCKDLRQRCSERPCFAKVDCTNTEIGVDCGPCPPGYEGDGFECEDFRPRCKERPCYPHVKCTNTETGVSCGSCPRGYSGDGVTCVSIRERCRHRPCFKGSRCRNVVDGVVCGPCPAGFSGDGRNCVDVRVRCASNPCFRGVTCVDKKMGVKCGRCPAGFKGDGFTCSDVRERCTHDPCFSGVNCTDSDVGVACGPCPIGYVGNGRRCRAKQQCSENPCHESVTCTDTENGVKCGSCPQGYSGDGFLCVQQHCSDKPCYTGVECKDTDGGVLCGQCPTGWTGTGFNCTVLRCVDNPCHANVQCRDTEAGVQCGRCPTGMSGDGFVCASLPLCEDIVCPVNSVCRETENKVVCVSCPPGYEPNNGRCQVTREKCSDQPCHPGVECNDTKVGVNCGDCPVGLTGNGKYCLDKRKTCGGPSRPCFAGVRCTDTEQGALCGRCPTGYIGNGVSCTDICHTKRNPCFTGVRCYHTPSGTKCGRCPAGMSGDGFRCEKKRACRENPCYPGVECTDTRSGEVQCGACPSGFEGDGYKCTDLRIWCDDSPCWSAELCTDTESGAKCAPCPSGYSGDGITCVDVDECAVRQPCSSLTTCTNTIPGYFCGRCPTGFREIVVQEFQVSKQICELDNPCTQNNGGCVQNSECIFIPGNSSRIAHFCGHCNIGYRGNQTTGCYKIRCEYCCEHAFCTRLKNNLFSCECDVGWAGDGIFCGPDRDYDGFADVQVPCESGDCTVDNCPNVANMGQEDFDGDGMGNYCDADADNDDIPNREDNCWLSPNPDQLDSDADSHGDACDNCPSVPNYNQLDTDDDGTGDECDADMDNDGTENQMDICPKVAADSMDYDGDAIGDRCDNCPRTFNVDQRDSDQDGVGDKCDTDMDSDGDGVQDDRDNCLFALNPEQLDTDDDGLGDACDDDDDGDGVLDYSIPEDLDMEKLEFEVARTITKRMANISARWERKPKDNCRLVSNPDQVDNDENGIGDDCDGDLDGDGVDDDLDACPENPNIQRPDFSKYTTVLLDPDGDAQMNPYWVVFSEGREMLQTVNSDPGMAIGKDAIGGVEYSGTVQVNTEADDDYMGIIFSYQSNGRFYAVLWKQRQQDYWWPGPFSATAQTGIQLKVIKSKTGPGPTLRNAIWHTGDTDDQVRLLWHDQNGSGWRHLLPYQFHITHRPSVGYIRVVMKLRGQVISDSGEVNDDTLKGGRLGVFAFSQEHVIWSDLTYRCNETIPLEYGVEDSVKRGQAEKKKI